MHTKNMDGADSRDEMLRQVVARANRYAGQRLRERRQALGLTQQQVAVMVGVTIQQVFKYETALNRMTVGRLFEMAQALNMPAASFFENHDGRDCGLMVSARDKLSLEIARAFNAIESVKRQESLVALARVMAELCAVRARENTDTVLAPA